MNYDKIIVELLARIQALEEQVEILKSKEINSRDKESRISTADIRNYIKELKKKAKEAGSDTLTLKSGDIHRDKKLKSSMPMVCNAMRQCMDDDDRILHQTPSGQSSTLEIEYKL